MNRQRAWQIKQEAAGKCRVCGKRAVNKNHCKKHAKQAAERALAWYYKNKKK